MYPVCTGEGGCVVGSAEIEWSEVVHCDMVCDMDEGLKNGQNLW